MYYYYPTHFTCQLHSVLRAETLDHDVPAVVANYCHAALNSLEEAIAHLALRRRRGWRVSWWESHEVRGEISIGMSVCQRVYRNLLHLS